MFYSFGIRVRGETKALIFSVLLPSLVLLDQRHVVRHLPEVQPNQVSSVAEVWQGKADPVLGLRRRLAPGHHHDHAVARVHAGLVPGPEGKFWPKVELDFMSSV